MRVCDRDRRVNLACGRSNSPRSITACQSFSQCTQCVHAVSFSYINHCTRVQNLNSHDIVIASTWRIARAPVAPCPAGAGAHAGAWWHGAGRGSVTLGRRRPSRGPRRPPPARWGRRGDGDPLIPAAVGRRQRPSDGGRHRVCRGRPAGPRPRYGHTIRIATTVSIITYACRNRACRFQSRPRTTAGHTLRDVQVVDGEDDRSDVLALETRVASLHQVVAEMLAAATSVPATSSNSNNQPMTAEELARRRTAPNRFPPPPVKGHAGTSVSWCVALTQR